MKRYRLVLTIACLVVLTGAGLVVYAAEQDKTSAAFRNQFVDDFQRTGLNTTPGDAMMLRILVESSGADALLYFHRGCRRPVYDGGQHPGGRDRPDRPQLRRHLPASALAISFALALESVPARSSSVSSPSPLCC